MIHTYRYRWIGLNIGRVNTQIDPLLPAAIVKVGTRPLIDLTADDSTKTDLDEAMLAQGWEYRETDPAQSPDGLVIRQEVFAKVINDTLTMNTAFEDLISFDVTTEGNGWLTIIGAGTTECLGALGYLRTTLNGAPVSSTSSLIGASNKFLAGRVQVPAGTYTVKLQWRVDAAGTQHVRPFTRPEAEFASLLVREMSM